jgi:hypothetical protein
MESKYQDKYERTMLEDDFKFCRLVEGYSLYKKWNGEVIIAKVNEKGKLEVLLHNILNEVKEE